MATAQFIQKLQLVEAVQYTGNNQQEIIDFTGGVAMVNNGKFVLTNPLSPDWGGTEILNTNWISKGAGGVFSCYSDLTFKTLFGPASA